MLLCLADFSALLAIFKGQNLNLATAKTDLVAILLLFGSSVLLEDIAPSNIATSFQQALVFTAVAGPLERLFVAFLNWLGKP